RLYRATDRPARDRGGAGERDRPHQRLLRRRPLRPTVAQNLRPSPMPPGPNFRSVSLSTLMRGRGSFGSVGSVACAASLRVGCWVVGVLGAGAHGCMMVGWHPAWANAAPVAPTSASQIAAKHATEPRVMELRVMALHMTTSMKPDDGTF